MDLAERQGKALLAAVKDKGFTPRRKDVSALVGLLDTDDDDAVDDILRAVLAHPEEALERAMERFPEARPPTRGRLVKLVGRLLAVPALAQRTEEIWRWVMERLEDADPKTRRNAILVMGRSPLPVAEDALLATRCISARVFAPPTRPSDCATDTRWSTRSSRSHDASSASSVTGSGERPISRMALRRVFASSSSRRPSTHCQVASARGASAGTASSRPTSFTRRPRIGGRAPAKRSIARSSASSG